eukprot:jgi/Psemu1/320890/estExt_fgenesh1_pm.C_9170002
MKKTLSNPALCQQLDKSSWLWTPPGSTRKKYESHDFPGYGSYDVKTTPNKSDMELIGSSIESKECEEEKLGELEATAISGNDILSSTFYVSGLVTLSAGKLAPLCLTLVGFVLYLFRGIYHETVTALPCNGGTYNILLNCTSKQTASMAAVFAIIAYITTGVVSALEAIAYLQTILPENYQIDQQLSTIALLFFFCLLTNLGMSESAVVARTIFVIHVTVLSLLSILGFIFMIFHSDMLYENWQTPYPSVDAAGDILSGSLFTALFYGFSSAMLGVSGFETSSQFVEEQAPGVFPKTLKNMWMGVMLFNPLLSLVSFAAMPLDEIMENKDTVLARMADIVGQWLQRRLNISEEHVSIGSFFAFVISVDAFIVLAAALLTGYVGINGLIRRMSMDRCLPQFFLIPNPWTGTDSYILVGFFLLCVSQVILLDSDVEALGGVYCYAFLTVMTIFALGNILLKIKRPSLPREITTSWSQSILGLIAVVIALLGNILGKPELLTYFFVYFLIVGTLVLIMFQRVHIVRLLYKVFKSFHKKQDIGIEASDSQEREDEALLGKNFSDIMAVIDDDEEKMVSGSVPKPPKRHESCLERIASTVKSFQDTPFIFFMKHDDLHMANKAVLYIQKNEQTNKIIFVHCTTTSTGKSTKNLQEHVKLLDLLYPRVKISLLVVHSSFDAATVEWLSRTLEIPSNAMFISCPDENFSMKKSQLRGIRIIASYD